MRNVSRSIVHRELTSARAVLDKWIKEVESGVPGEDYPAEEVESNDDEAPRNPQEFYQKFCGELLLVSGKCETLTTILQAEDL